MKKVANALAKFIAVMGIITVSSMALYMKYVRSDD